jgi:S-DNA-T family DNA segregation ATPase FtsK/SpoIIIE
VSEIASETFAGQVRTLVGERQREIVLLLTLFVSTFSLLALFGYQEADSSFLLPGPGKVENPCGPLGAHLSAVLFYLFGVGAYCVFFVMVGSVLVLARRSSPTWTQLAWSVVVFSALLSAISMFGEMYAPVSPGGWLGQSQRIALESMVGPTGTVLVIGTMLTLSATVLFEIRWTSVFEGLALRFDRLVPVVQGYSKSTGHKLMTMSGFAARWSGKQLVSSAGGASLRGKNVRAASWKVIQRMGRSLTRKEGDFQTDLEWVEGSGYHEKSKVDLAFGQVADSDATAVAAPAPIAEVEWDPTAAMTPQDDKTLLNMFPDLELRSVQRTSATPEVEFDDLPDDPDDTQASENDPPTMPIDAAPSWQSRAVASPQSQPFLLGIPVTGADSQVEGEDRTPVMIQREESPVSTPSTLSSVASNRPPEEPDENTSNSTGAGIKVEVMDKLETASKDDGGVIRKPTKNTVFKLPKLSLLDVVPKQKATFDPEELRQLAVVVEETLASFKVAGEVTDVRVGPVVTIFEFLPAAGVSVRKISNLSDDLCMALKANSVRIVAPIPGKGVVGIEIPSSTRMTIFLRELMAAEDFRNSTMDLPCVIGKDVEGTPVVTDLTKMPHLLVGGTTGSGKSVGINGILLSLLYTCTPDNLRMLLVDPKKLEFKLYQGIPHLLHPVVTEAKGASAALAWACREMDQRYELLARWDTRNIVNYNKKVERELKAWTKLKAIKYAPPGWAEHETPPLPEKMPYIVIVIDELADLMMVAKNEVQDSIVRLAQMARACGIHIILATQRPSVDVITGLIKSNMPTRIAFKLRSSIDSRTVLDSGGAEKLLGRGDLLMLPNAGDVVRCHGAFVSDEEVDRVTSFWRGQASPEYIEMTIPADKDGMDSEEEERDPLFEDAVDIVVRAGKASTSMVQRQLRIGYNRAARIIESMEMAGVVGPPDGARPREVLIDRASSV